MLFEQFRKLRETAPNQAAFLITSGDRSLPISWRQFTDDIDLVARLIRTHAPRATIAILGENSYEWMVGHAAVLFSGATVVPLDTNLSPTEIADRLRFVGAVALVYSSLYDDKAHAAEKLMPGIAIAAFGSIKTERFLEKMRGIFRPSDSIWDGSAPHTSADSNHTSMIVFTSGTTSEPRGAELTLKGIESFCSLWGSRLGMDFGSRSLMLLPLHHIFGICSTYLMLSKGVALGVCPDFRRIFDAFERFRVNFAFLVPALADILAAKIEQHADSAEEALGQPIDWILTGGAALTRRTYERLTALGIKTITAYGLTETTAVYSVTPSAGEAHVGAQGKVPDESIETKVSPSGELLVRGPCVMKGYYRRPEKTAAVLEPDGWYHTGDLGKIDDEGYVWILGRASRTIVLSSGKKVAPEELEAKLAAIPGVREAVVSGEGLTREIKAEVYGTIPEPSLRRAIGQMNLQLPVYKRINTVIVRAEPFPRTSSGKIRVG